MVNGIWKKDLVLCIIVLFIIAGFTASVSGSSVKEGNKADINTCNNIIGFSK